MYSERWSSKEGPNTKVVSYSHLALERDFGDWIKTVDVINFSRSAYKK